ISPTTTKGDILVDNGANSPNSSLVRFGVGSNGKVPVADSTQATGLNYKAILPNGPLTPGTIGIFSTGAGSPAPLASSNMAISSTGALQSAPSGGNARGI